MHPTQAFSSVRLITSTFQSSSARPGCHFLTRYCYEIIMARSEWYCWCRGNDLITLGGAEGTLRSALWSAQNCRTGDSERERTRTPWWHGEMMAMSCGELVFHRGRDSSRNNWMAVTDRDRDQDRDSFLLSYKDGNFDDFHLTVSSQVELQQRGQLSWCGRIRKLYSRLDE